ncbi:glucokinase [Kaistia sp. 32K]|uniref:ROK family protein n=1 Tax=Kaistia sp. 32K TaxID=2795690 RepID=UPI00191639A8|nr:ROK family protein [Kaistia sp. 32K]BCP53417.1 glucokinase [Kaistia sp. 32K]
MTKTALAIDLGGTELRAALVTERGDIAAFAATRTDARGGPEAVIEQMVGLVEKVRGEAPDARPVGLGVGAPGPLDPEAGIVVDAPTLTGWKNVPLVAILGRRLGLPVRLENDANAAALGEWRFGAGQGTQSMVFVTVSTGIGAGVIVDGRLLHGRRGLAGEIGHMAISDRPERCACGSTGCFEALASGTALAREAAKLVASGAAPGLARIAGADPVTGRHVAEAARAGDAPALALLNEEARWLGIGLTNLLHLYSPERLILGGGVGSLLPLMRAEIERTIRQRAMLAFRDIPVVGAKLGSHAGLVGAASLVL